MIFLTFISCVNYFTLSSIQCGKRFYKKDTSFQHQINAFFRFNISRSIPFFPPPLSQRSSVRPPPNAVVIDSTSFFTQYSFHSIPMQHSMKQRPRMKEGGNSSRKRHQRFCTNGTNVFILTAIAFNLLLEKFHSGGGGRGFALFPSAPLNLILKEIRYSV